MFRSLYMLDGARKIVTDCATAKPGEDVVIVADTDRAHIAEVIALAATEVGAVPTVIITARRAHDGAEVPEPVVRAMEAADLVLLPVSKSITHSQGVKRALGNGARVLSMVKASEETLTSGGIDMDFRRHRPRCIRIADAFTAAKTARVTTPAGTDIVMSLEGRTGNAHSGVVDEPGAFSASIHVEANIAPREDSANGTIVVDGSIPNLYPDVLREPVVLTVESGAVVDITGGVVADQLRRFWRELGDAHAYTIGQLAVGLNTECLTLNGNHVNDHGAFGFVHFGIGTSENIGGGNRAEAHIDVMVSKPTLVLDGDVKIVVDGDVIESAHAHA
jgi:2,5-dihydroxypyridine 5,6-dioxygenase